MCESKGKAKELLEQQAQGWSRGHGTQCGLFVRLSSVSLWLFLNKIVRGRKVKDGRAAHPTVHRT